MLIFKGAKLASATSDMARVDFLPRPISVQEPNISRNTLKFFALPRLVLAILRAPIGAPEDF